MIINNPVINSFRTQDSVRRGPADESALPSVAASAKPGQEFIPAGSGLTAPGQLAAAPSLDNERIDLRVLDAAPVSRPEQRAITSYQSTAELGNERGRVSFGVDEIA